MQSKHVLIAAGVLVLILALWFVNLFQAPGKNSEIVRFVVPVGISYSDIVGELKSQGFIKSTWIFSLVMRESIKPGGYRISGNMSVFTLAAVFKGEPYMNWVTVPEGLRKEEIADLLAQKLNWTDAVKKEFVNAPSKLNWPLKDGLYFPETYLFPKDEDGYQIAARMFSKFNEELNPHTTEFAKQNIKWTTGMKLASIIQREAAGKSDMNLISGILWNRLDQSMQLDVDATIQYVKGKEGNWWPQLGIGDRNLDSPYNTYLNRGLPPAPISDPGLDAILAVLNPTKTKCLYYLHDANRQIHCAVTYAEHQANIEKYLK